MRVVLTDIEIMAIILMNIKVKFNFTVLQINPRFRYLVSGKLEQIVIFDIIFNK
jgi:hypothetical protein